MNKKIKIECLITLGIVALVLVTAPFAQVVYGTSKIELAPLQGYSDQYNHGFSDGYLSIKSPGLHTQEYLTGYKNGTSSFQWNKGYSQGFTHLPMSEKTSDYLDGYGTGRNYSIADPHPGNGNVSGALPAHTNDNYMDYYIGVHNGAVAADNDNKQHGPGSLVYRGCPVVLTGHEEYCVGYKSGYSYETWVHNVLEY